LENLINKYLNKLSLLKNLIKNKGTKEENQRIKYIGLLISTTNFSELNEERKKILKENMLWCNKTYKKYLDS
jgi:hypothetical protein